MPHLSPSLILYGFVIIFSLFSRVATQFLISTVCNSNLRYHESHSGFYKWANQRAEILGVCSSNFKMTVLRLVEAKADIFDDSVKPTKGEDDGSIQIDQKERTAFSCTELAALGVGGFRNSE